jgi:tripartite ATP-independent transporter DctM subunit
MPNEIVGILSIVVLLALVFGGMRIAFATFLLAFLGIVVIKGWAVGLGVIGGLPYAQVTNVAYIVLPMFILMGFFMAHAGLADEIFIAAQKWVGHLPGGLALTTIFGSAGFAACTGSSASACAVAGRILVPKMLDLGYHPRLATGVVAASGTMASLIPPSIMVVIYGIITEQSIGALLIGGFLPGILEAVTYGAFIIARVVRNPKIAPVSVKVHWKERLDSMKGISTVIVVIVLMLGGLYFGVFSPSEAGAAGAVGVFLIVLVRRRASWKMITGSVRETLDISIMVFIVIVGILTYTNFMSLSGSTQLALDFIVGLEVNRYVILLLILVVYLILGAFIGSVGMMLLTLPLVFPMIVGLGFNPIWFGIIVIKMVEVGMITPPIGVNCYVVNSVTGIPLTDVFKGALPFVLLDFIDIAILIVFPQIVTFLPSLMKLG